MIPNPEKCPHCGEPHIHFDEDYETIDTDERTLDIIEYWYCGFCDGRFSVSAVFKIGELIRYEIEKE